MSFIDNLKSTMKNFAQKTSDVVEVQKLNLAILQEKDQVKKLYTKIGEEVYRQFLLGNDLGFNDKCNEIALLEAKIEEFENKIMKLKNTKKCDGCGSEISADAAFCPKCGTKAS
ncbi:MAG: zinc ribbon domain-containing protein [Clostridiaceae bacterium]|jgi:rRNA maturation endonuclease Nob1|nr:zinc ribbon domain-containing protein [Clostridiaceae bacterium]